MDYGKFLYQQEKKEREAKKHQKQIVVKEVKFRINVDDHDYETKKNHVLRFWMKATRSRRPSSSAVVK